jgi:hypothetical protein
MDLSNLWSNLPDSKPISRESVDEINRLLASEFKNAAKLVTALYNVKEREKAHHSQSHTQTQNSHSQTHSHTSQPSSQSLSQTAFAKAAKSVASLYRLSHSSNEVNHLNGYLTCLDDLLKVLLEGGDVENWALTRRAEICKPKSADTDIHDATQEADAQAKRAEEENTEMASSPVSEAFQLPKDHEFYLGDEFVAPFQFRPGFAPLSVTHSQRQRNNWMQIRKEREAFKHRADEKYEPVETEEGRKRKAVEKARKRKEQRKE